MSINRSNRADDSAEERETSPQGVRQWWSELSLAAKVLIPTTGVVLAFVTVNALPPLVV